MRRSPRTPGRQHGGRRRPADDPFDYWLDLVVELLLQPFFELYFFVGFYCLVHLSKPFFNSTIANYRLENPCSWLAIKILSRVDFICRLLADTLSERKSGAS